MVSKDLSLELRKGTMRRFVLHMETMEMAMFGQASVSQKGSSKDRLLNRREIRLRSRTSLGVVLFHTSTLVKGCDRRFTDTAGLVIGITPEEDRYLSILFAPPAFAPQRQVRPRKPPSPPVFLLISAHFTATPGIPLSPTYL